MEEVKRNNALRLKIPVVVEGKYDKCAILGIFSGTVISTDGFGVFNSREKQALIRRISENGIIVLTDSDGGGKQIRAFLSGLIPKERIINLYIPKIEGKERRKVKRSKEGYLGVEGVGGDVLRSVLLPFTEEGAPIKRGDIKSFDMFTLGLSGRDDSSRLRDEVCRELALPDGMSAKAACEAFNIIADREIIENIVKKLTNF